MSHVFSTLDYGCIAAFVVLAVSAAASDWFRFTIPNRIPAAIVIVWLMHVGLLAGQGQPVSDAAWSAGVALVVFLVGTALFAVNLLGGGDAKLLAAASLWAPLDWVPAFIMAVTVSGAVVGLAFLVPAFGHRPPGDVASAASGGGRAALTGRLKRKIPYATAIAVGCGVVGLKLANILPAGG